MRYTIVSALFYYFDLHGLGRFCNFVVMDSKSFVNILAERTGRQPDQIASLIKSFADIVVDTVKDGDSIAIPGFGTFEPKMKNERVATHPSTGKKLLVPPRLSLVFKPSAILKQKVRKQ